KAIALIQIHVAKLHLYLGVTTDELPLLLLPITIVQPATLEVTRIMADIALQISRFPGLTPGVNEAPQLPFLIDNTGIKILYVLDRQKPGIYSEDYRGLVDDPFPVRSLLARVGADTAVESAPRKKDFKIRLVSTDEPDVAGSEDNEFPRPSAPSQGFSLQKIASVGEALSDLPPIDANSKLEEVSPSGKLIVAPMKRRPPMTVALPKVPAPRRASAQDEPGGQKEESITSSIVAALHAPKRQEAAVHKEKVTKKKEGKKESRKNSDESTRDKKLVMEFLHKWKSSWEQKNLDIFIKMYHPNFQAEESNYESFKELKKHFFRKYKDIRVEIQRVEIRKAQGRYIVRFLQSFQGDKYRDKGWKNMVLAKSKGRRFIILTEGWSPL
ncbi:hypothetical protein ACFL2Q_06785, partial [Thermodesulfobacteriota bacterium]